MEKVPFYRIPDGGGTYLVAAYCDSEKDPAFSSAKYDLQQTLGFASGFNQFTKMKGGQLDREEECWPRALVDTMQALDDLAPGQWLFSLWSDVVVTQGPYKGIRALAIGSNRVAQERAACVALLKTLELLHQKKSLKLPPLSDARSLASLVSAPLQLPPNCSSKDVALPLQAASLFPAGAELAPVLPQQPSSEVLHQEVRPSGSRTGLGLQCLTDVEAAPLLPPSPRQGSAPTKQSPAEWLGLAPAELESRGDKRAGPVQEPPPPPARVSSCCYVIDGMDVGNTYGRRHMESEWPQFELEGVKKALRYYFEMGLTLVLVLKGEEHKEELLRDFCRESEAGRFEVTCTSSENYAAWILHHALVKDCRILSSAQIQDWPQDCRIAEHLREWLRAQPADLQVGFNFDTSLQFMPVTDAD